MAFSLGCSPLCLCTSSSWALLPIRAGTAGPHRWAQKSPPGFCEQPCPPTSDSWAMILHLLAGSCPALCCLLPRAALLPGSHPHPCPLSFLLAPQAVVFRASLYRDALPLLRIPTATASSELGLYSAAATTVISMLQRKRELALGRIHGVTMVTVLSQGKAAC